MRGLRISLLIVILGVSVAVGTVAEGMFPLTILNEPAFVIPGDANQFLFANITLFARSYILSMNVFEGGPIDICLYDSSGQFQLEINSSRSTVQYGSFPFRGIYYLLITNRNSSQTSFRASFLLYGIDQQQMLVAEILFAAGFITSLILIIFEWLHTPPPIDEGVTINNNRIHFFWGIPVGDALEGMCGRSLGV